MIGIIGPADSVALALAVATEDGFLDRVVPRVYEHADEAVSIAAELDSTCHVILFTGQVPYALTNNSDSVRAELQFISHSGASLYRAIARVLIDHNGSMPTVSVDSMDEPIVVSAFSDLGLPTPVAHPLELTEDDLPTDGVQDIVEFHRHAVASGRVEAVLTCLAEVYAQLRVDGITVWRIEHPTMTVREALHKALLSDRLIRSRSEQLALALFQIDSQALRKLDVYEREVARLHVHREMLDLARKSGGRLTALEGGSFSIATSRGSIESAIERQQSGQASLLDPIEIDVDVRGGIGIGSSFSQAESNARQAISLSQPRSATLVVFPDGRVHAAADPTSESSILRLQDSSGAVRQLAARLGVGTLTVRRLIEAVNRTGNDPVTTQQLADAYGVQPRSARRLITALVREGFARDAGVWSRPSAGRPQALYTIDAKSLAAIVGRPASDGQTADLVEERG